MPPNESCVFLGTFLQQDHVKGLSPIRSRADQAVWSVTRVLLLESGGGSEFFAAFFGDAQFFTAAGSSNVSPTKRGRVAEH